MLRKIIKKLTRFVLWTLGSLVVLLVVAYFALQSPPVQTWLAQRAAGWLSDELGTRVTVGGVNIEFVKKIVLEDVYIEDKHQDTILLASRLKVDISDFSYDAKYMNIADIALVDARIKLKKYANERGLNYRFILKYFDSGDTTQPKSKSPWRVDLGTINLTNVDLDYTDTRDTAQSRGMDFEDIRVRSINARISQFNPQDTTTQFKIDFLAATERSGFTLRNLTTQVTVSPKAIQLDNLNIRTPESNVNGFLGFHFNTIEDIEDDFIHLVEMDGHFYNTALEMSDIAYFAPELKGMRKRINLTGDVKGKVDRLRCKDVDIVFGDRSRISGNFSFTGLPDIDETNMYFKIRDLTTNKNDLDAIPLYPFTSGKLLETPEGFAALGDLHFKGVFEGFLHDFVAYGDCNTAIGNISLRDFAFIDGGEGQKINFSGEHLRADNFNIGSYLGIPEMGNITADLKVSGSGLKADNIVSELQGQVHSFTFNNYAYHNLDVNGVLSKRNFSGELKVNEENIQMDFNGDVNYSGKLPVMNFHAEIEHANMVALHFMDTKDTVILKTIADFALTGDNLDNLIGSATLRNLDYKRNSEKYHINEIKLEADENKIAKSLFLKGDFIDANVIGTFKIEELGESVKDIMSAYLPAYFPPRSEKKKKLSEQNFGYNFDFEGNTDPIQILIPGLQIARGTHFGGRVNTAQQEISGSLTSTNITYDKRSVQGIGIYASKAGNKLNVNGGINRIQFTDTLWVGGLTLNGNALNNVVDYTIAWDNKTQHTNKGGFSGVANFFSPKSFEVVMNKGQVSLEDSTWTADPNANFRVDSSQVMVSNFMFRSGKQGIGASGIVGKNPFDKLRITLQKFNLAVLNRFTGNDLKLNGIVGGEVQLSNLYTDVIFDSDIRFTDFWLNNKRIGTGEVKANWLAEKQAIKLNGGFTKIFNAGVGSNNQDKTLVFDGYYYPKQKENSLDIALTMNYIDLSMFAPYVKDYCSVFIGDIVKGNAKLTGTPEKPVLNGDAIVSSKKIQIDYLNTYISFNNQKITIEGDPFSYSSFAVDSFYFFDPHGDTAIILNGHLFHKNFSNFNLDFDVQLNHFQVLNTVPKDNELYYGQLFTSGEVNIYGLLDDVHLDANLRTDKIKKGRGLLAEAVSSTFNIPMETVDEVSENDFITFKKDTTLINAPVKTNYTGITIDMYVEATPDCEVKLIFDEKVGDVITARGSGDLRMQISSSGDFKLFGDYHVQQGEYLFTLKNLINKKFTIDPGGSIVWTGDPYKAEMAMAATYKVTTSVKPFFPYDSLDIYSRQYPVECKLLLTGDLMKPDINFDVQLPGADPAVNEGVQRFLQTEEERNKQVFALLVMNSFITPAEYRELGYSNGTNNALYSTGTELLSAQISNWLSQISNEFDLGVIFHPDDELSNQELRVYMGTQVLNDRLTIDGNLGMQSQTSSTSNIVGDVNVEYKITDDGKVRLKAFNRSIDNTLNTAGVPYTQGVGVFYREDFDTVAELYRRYLLWIKTDRQKKATEPKTPQPAEKPQIDTVPAPPAKTE